MAKNLAAIHVYGDQTSSVFVGPKGTTGPTTLATPVSPFVEVGWISEGGVTQSRSQDATSFRAWQGAQVVRRKITSTEDTFSFQALEENAVTHGLLYRGQVPVVATGVATTTITNQSVVDDRAWVIDLIDGSVTKRFVIPSGSHELTGDVVYSNGDLTVYEFTVTVQGDYFELTNAPAVVGP
jgi:hypothetical protein